MESEVLFLANKVVTLNETDLIKLKEYYSPYLVDSYPQGALFAIRVEGCTITAYRSGKVLFQGKKSETEAEKWIQFDIAETKPIIKKTRYSPPERISTMSVIGSDEVGTGDYFGPITVAAVYVAKEKISTLQSLGVKDSKKLSDNQIIALAGKLIQTVPYSLLILKNEKYNELQQSGMSQGKMKAMLHNQAIDHVCKKIAPKEPEAILIDQFVEPSIYFRHNLNKDIPFQDRTFFITKAESIHVSVAIASIISRYAFLKEIEKLSEMAGFPLPKGAGKIVDEACAKLIEIKGKEALSTFTKRHFANTKKALSIYEK